MFEIAIDHSARGFARWLEEREQFRTGQNVPEARKAVASKARLSPGTLENLARDRLKRGVDLLKDRLQAVVVAELWAEVERNLHELDVLEKIGGAGSEEQVGEVLESLSATRDALRRARRKG